MPRKGEIAVCSHGYLGLITCDEPSRESATAGNVGAEIWTGIHLTTKNGKVIGAPWQSRNPRVIGNSYGLLSVFEKAKKWDDLQAERREQREREERQREPGEAYVLKKTGPFTQPYESPRFNDIHNPRADYNPEPQIRNTRGIFGNRAGYGD